MKANEVRSYRGVRYQKSYMRGYSYFLMIGDFGYNGHQLQEMARVALGHKEVPQEGYSFLQGVCQTISEVKCQIDALWDLIGEAKS